MELFGLPLSLVLGAALVGVGLGVVGFGDLLKFSPGRVWAIGGVVFREGLRRRIWLVPPLVMLATLLLTRLADPSDEVDAIRQATQFCLLASGLVAVLVTLILACTNLPREVESRVIFTVVTKPVSRLELYVGKLTGFARLSALLLVVMGVFSYALLWAMNRSLVNGIEDRLGRTVVQESRRSYLEHLAQTGLLQARRVSGGQDLQVYAEPPAGDAETGAAPRWFYSTEYYAAVPFRFPAQTAARYLDGDSPPEVRLTAELRLPWRQLEQRPTLPGDPPLGIVNLANLPPAPPPRVSLQVLDGALFNVVGPTRIPDNNAQLPVKPDDPDAPSAEISLTVNETRETLRAAQDSRDTPVYFAVYGLNEEYVYGVTPRSASLRLEERDDAGGWKTVAVLQPAVGERPRADLLVRTYLGQGGLGLAGPTSDLPPPTGVLAFRDAPAATPGPDGRVGFDLSLRVDPNGDVLDQSEEPRLGVSVYNLTTGLVSDTVVANVSTGQESYVSFPPDSVAGGDFDLRLQSLTRGQIVTARGGSIRLVVSDTTPFAWNLAKALLAQWLLSVLVAAAGLTFSTFVGWPIAVTLTVVLLTGRWVGQQLGTALGTTGRQTAIDVFGSGGDVNAKEALRAGVDALQDLFNTVTAFLPDVGVFGLGDRVERGLNLPLADVGTALLVTLAFVLPLTALAYLVLRRKEVAP